MPAKRKSAFSAALREAQQQHSDTVSPLDSDTVKQQHSGTVLPSSGETVQQQYRETVSPLDSDTVERQHSETVPPLGSETVEQQHSEAGPLQYGETAQHSDSNTVTQQHRKTVKKERKISFYLTSEQERKLDNLAYDFLQRTGKRINRNDIVRFLVDQANGDLLIDRLDLHK